MQVEVDLKCMQTNFGGCGHFGCGDIAPFLFAFKTAKTSLRTMELKYRNFVVQFIFFCCRRLNSLLL